MARSNAASLPAKGSIEPAYDPWLRERADNDLKITRKLGSDCDVFTIQVVGVNASGIEVNAQFRAEANIFDECEHRHDLALVTQSARAFWDSLTHDQED